MIELISGVTYLSSLLDDIAPACKIAPFACGFVGCEVMFMPTPRSSPCTV
jgi:hypothetical protein